MSQATCQELARCLDAFVDGELDPSEMLSVQSHIEACRECAQCAAWTRAQKASVKRAVQSVRAPDGFRAQLVRGMNEHDESQGLARSGEVSSPQVRMLSWRVVGPLAVAAAMLLVLGSLSESRRLARQQGSSSVGSASAMSLDTFLDELVDQHAHPLPPETTNPKDMAGLDRFVGVPVRAPTLHGELGTLVGARVVPVRQNRAAMLQYVLANGHRASVYVYNPREVRVVATPRLREHLIENAAVYVGLVHGYSVAVTSTRGVGYAVASDEDEQGTSRMIVAMDRGQ